MILISIWIHVPCPHSELSIDCCGISANTGVMLYIGRLLQWTSYDTCDSLLICKTSVTAQSVNCHFALKVMFYLLNKTLRCNELLFVLLVLARSMSSVVSSHCTLSLVVNEESSPQNQYIEPPFRKS